MSCRKCGESFEPKPWQLRVKASGNKNVCATCRREYDRDYCAIRKALGRPRSVERAEYNREYLRSGRAR